MSYFSNLSTCGKVCLALGVLLGLFVAWCLASPHGWLIAILWGALAAFLAQWLLRALFCGSKAEAVETSAKPAVATAPASVAASAPAAEAKPASKPAASKPAAKKPAAKPAAKKAPAAKTTAKPAAKKPAAKAAAGGTRPEALKKARAGGADDLKLIKGVGPKLEKLCNKLGFYHFDQVAAWKKAEVQWVDENLEGFKGRVSRDEWVKQAKILAKGGQTEFSKKKTKSK